MLTTDDVKVRVEEIREGDGDWEGQHGDEKDLWEEVLRHLAAHAASPEDRDIAAAALESLDLEFNRGFA